jgi:hypothetical protein
MQSGHTFDYFVCLPALYMFMSHIIAIAVIVYSYYFLHIISFHRSNVTFRSALSHSDCAYDFRSMFLAGSCLVTYPS